MEGKITRLAIAVTENSSKTVQNITRELRRKTNSSHQRETKSNRYLKRDERDISSGDDEEVNMLSTYTTECNIEEACLSEEEGDVFLDNCASSKLFIIRDQSCLESFVYSGGAI